MGDLTVMGTESRRLPFFPIESKLTNAFQTEPELPVLFLQRLDFGHHALFTISQARFHTSQILLKLLNWDLTRCRCVHWAFRFISRLPWNCCTVRDDTVRDFVWVLGSRGMLGLISKSGMINLFIGSQDKFVVRALRDKLEFVTTE